MTTSDDYVDEYLHRLDDALADIPRPRRRELVEEIADHIADARAERPGGGEAEVRELLDRLGEPEEIALHALERLEFRPRRSPWPDRVALVLLLLGGFAAGVGWIVGVALLWASEAWSTREKLLGTLVVPGGLALSSVVVVGVLAGVGETCRGGSGVPTQCSGGPSTGAEAILIVGLVLLFLAPFATTAFLAHRMNRHASTMPA